MRQPPYREHTNVGKFTVLEDEKVVLLTQSLKLDDEILIKVLYDVNVRLNLRESISSC